VTPDVDRTRIVQVKKLYLMRHAKSDWGDPKLEDHERPLNGRGRKGAKLIADHIRATGIAPDVVLCSSAKRAVETLDKLRAALPEGADVKIEPKLYGATSQALLTRIKRLSSRASSVLIVGHDPAMHELILELAARGADLDEVRRKFPTAGLAVLEARVNTWGELAPQKASLKSFVSPKLLKG
jgi:phosphohistidine phosphatase